MYFNSIIFILVFLPVVFCGYFALLRQRHVVTSKIWLCFASLFFYGYWKVDYLVLMLISICFNFLIGIILNAKNIWGRKLILATGVALNLATLAYFKYTNFLIDTVKTIFGFQFNIHEILLPLAISFFTFQQIAYIVDSYSRKTEEHDFFDYILFVTFFPQLVAGPIVHHKDMMSQFRTSGAQSINIDNINKGVFIFILGLAKKVIVADYLATIAAPGFSHPEALEFSTAWVASLSYTFQLYFDFSGYCDMAIGIALLFNIKLPLNFNSPYKAVNIEDFWKRWHITLTIWLRDYLYIPLGGNRKGDARSYLNVFLVFLLGGLWHGAGWTFIIWGILHGVACIVHKLYRKYLANRIPINKALAWIITFNFVNIGWVLFRSDKVSSAFRIIKKMYTFENQQILLYFLGLFYVCILLPNVIEAVQKVNFRRRILATALAIILLYCLWILSIPNQSSPFLYFNF